MKKSLWIVLLLGLVCILTLSACDYFLPSHTHLLTHSIKAEAQCNKAGNIEYWSCSDCGKYFSNSQGSSEITDKTSVILSKVDCSYVNNVCMWCKKGIASEGLSFTLSLDETFYSVTAGSCTDTDVVIPGYYNGLPVMISENAFQNNKTITDLTVLDGALSIGGGAFYCCSNLKNITLPDSINYIGAFAFSYTAYASDNANWDNGIMLYIDNCLISTKLATYYYQVYSIRNGTVCIAEQAFKDCSSVDEITIPDSVRNIGEWAFRGCSNLTNVTIGNGVSCIEYETFYGCKNLKSVTIGKSVTSIGKRAFYNCKKLDEIKYRGSETQWNAILKGIEWDMYYLGSYGAGTVKINYTITYNYTDE